MFSKKVNDEKNDKVELKNIRKFSEEYISVSHARFCFVVSYRFSSSSLNRITNSFFKINHKSLENSQEEFPDSEIILNEIEDLDFLITNDKYEKKSIKTFEKEFPGQIEKLKDIIIRIYVKIHLLILLKMNLFKIQEFLFKNLASPYGYFKRTEV